MDIKSLFVKIASDIFSCIVVIFEPDNKVESP